MPKATIAKAVERSLEEVLYEMTLQYPLIFSEDYNNVSRQKCFEKSLINIHALTKQPENNMTEDELITTLYENAKAGYLSSLPKKRKRADRRLTTSSQTSNCCERSRRPFAKGIGLSDIEDLFQQPSVPPIRQEMQGKVSETVTTFTNNAFDDSI
ncbi:hypothetical protein NQZ79_g4554 [Umbelopsis isabellina]|nr:hypothetical protein NQZ79_g4554 [Umbelopsis isabellina]